MTRISKTAAWAAMGIVGGAAAGVGYAAMSSPAAAGQSATTTTATAPAPRPGAGMRVGPRGLLKHLEHGQLTLRVRGGDKTVDLQRGTVNAVTPTSITVASQDGFTQTYVVTGTTRVRGKSGRESIGAVHQGDQVLVVAEAGRALRIADR